MRLTTCYLGVTIWEALLAVGWWLWMAGAPDARKRIGLIVDFDGTIAVPNPAAWLAERWLEEEWDVVRRQLDAGMITRQEMLSHCARLFPADPDVLTKEVLDNCKPVEGFGEFVRWCKENAAEMWVCTDGFSFYVRPFLAAHGFEGVTVIGNEIEWSTPPRIAFPHRHPLCPECGVCKRMVAQRMAQVASRVVLVGDGYNDRYAIPDVHLVFATGELRGFCRRMGICAVPWNSFRDLVRLLRLLGERLPGGGDSVTWPDW